jgi:UDP-glucose 4-epimerase
MKVVVTGGAGFIGANLTRVLEGHEVIDELVAYDDLSTGARSNLDGHGRTTLVEADILDISALTAACEGADCIVHLAARGSVPKSLEDPLASHHANATGTVHVLEVARAIGAHVVVASSSSVYGANPALPKHEELRPSPVSPYAVSKLATEAYTLAWARSWGLPVLAFRFFNVFGPLQPAGHAYAAVVPAFVSAALEGRPLPLQGDGTQSRDFTYVGTVCDVVAKVVLGRITHPEPVNLALGTRTTLLELIEVVSELLGKELDIEHLPRRAGDVDHSQADPTVLRSIAGDVTPVPLRDALTETIAWFRTL